MSRNLQIFRFLHKYCFPESSMKRLLILIVSLSILATGVRAGDNIPKGEWIILVGGPSLKIWEHYKAQPHDHWWANFVRAARLRTEQLRDGLGPTRPSPGSSTNKAISIDNRRKIRI